MSSIPITGALCNESETLLFWFGFLYYVKIVGDEASNILEIFIDNKGRNMAVTLSFISPEMDIRQTM